MPNHSFVVNGEKVTVDVESDVRLLWVLRDILGITGPKYGCSGGICRACTCHINGKAVPVCTVPVGQLRATDQIVTIEGLPATVGKELHPMQEAWIKKDVAQCGYCQPGQVMAAVALVKDVQAKRRKVTDSDLDAIRNVCRCGTYPRIREAIKLGEQGMPAPKRKKKKVVKKRAKRKPSARSSSAD
jgi:isoquinoline 1-oxidoreductase subunit alpha